MDPSEEPIHVIIRLPYARPEGFVNTQPVIKRQVQWTEAMEKTLWHIIGQTKPSLIDWNAISRQLGNIPVPFLIKHATSLFENQLQDLHRIGEQQDQTIQSTARGATGPSSANTSFEDNSTSQQNSSFSQGAFTTRDGSPFDSPKIGNKDPRKATKKEPSQILGTLANSSNPNINQSIESNAKIQASPSLSGSISTFPSHARPASMSSSASTIRPIQPSSPSPSLRSTSTTADANFYGSGVLSNRGPSQPRSTRGSQLISVAPSYDRRISNLISTLPTSPREDGSFTDDNKHIMEPSNPFQHATISASAKLGSSASGGKGSRSFPGSIGDNGQRGAPGFNDSERSSTVSSASTPYSQSNSTSQIFEETSFFNQLSSNDSLTRAQIRNENFEGLSSRGAFQQSYSQNQGVYGLGFMDPTPYYQQDHRMGSEDLDDDDDEASSSRDGDSVNQDDTGPLSEQIKQLHLEDVLAFLPRNGSPSSGVLPRLPNDTGYQRRTASGEKMPFQLDDELASLGTRTLGEIFDHDGGDDEDDHRVQGIRFNDSMRPIRSREGDPSKTRSSPERTIPNSRKSSAQNSVGSSFSDLSDSSITQSAMEDAYLSGYNNNSKMFSTRH